MRQFYVRELKFIYFNFLYAFLCLFYINDRRFSLNIINISKVESNRKVEFFIYFFLSDLGAPVTQIPTPMGPNIFELFFAELVMGAR